MNSAPADAAVFIFPFFSTEPDDQMDAKWDFEHLSTLVNFSIAVIKYQDHKELKETVLFSVQL